MRNILFTFLLCFIGFTALEAQQIHQLSNYITNDFAFNPAVVGKEADDVVIKGTFRKQWAGGFDGQEPTTYMLSAHANMNQRRTVGLGLMLYNDKTGPTERMGGQVAYSYHIPLEDTKRKFLALGISAGLLQYTINYDKIQVSNIGDPGLYMNGQSENKTTFDVNFGAYLHTPDYWIGVSALQLVKNHLDLGTDLSTNDDPLGINLAMHIYGSAGYNFDVGEDFDIVPSVLIKSVQNVPLHYELTLRGVYQEKYWVGLSYRAQDAISLMLGADWDNGLNFAYSYDIITSAINNVSNGSHEIMIGYDLDWQKGPMKAKPFQYKDYKESRL